MSIEIGNTYLYKTTTRKTTRRRLPSRTRSFWENIYVKRILVCICFGLKTYSYLRATYSNSIILFRLSSVGMAHSSPTYPLDQTAALTKDDGQLGIDSNSPSSMHYNIFFFTHFFASHWNTTSLFASPFIGPLFITLSYPLQTHPH